MPRRTLAQVQDALAKAAQAYLDHPDVGELNLEDFHPDEPRVVEKRRLIKPSYQVADEANTLVLAVIKTRNQWEEAVTDLAQMDERHEDYVHKAAHVGIKFQNYHAACRIFRQFVSLNGDIGAGV